MARIHNAHSSSMALLLIFCTILVTVIAESSESLSWTLYHAVVTPNQEPNFEKRSSITLKVPEESLAAVLEIENEQATQSSNKVMEQLLTNVDAPKLYQVKLVSDDDASRHPVVTSVPACQVLRANFRDEVILTFDSSANVIGISYVPLVSPLALTSCQQVVDQLPSLENLAFDSKISFETATPGMTLRTILPPMSKPPPGLKFFPKAKTAGPNVGGAGGGPSAEPEPITGPMDFFKRYWYIIVPIMLMNLFGSQPAAEEAKATGDGATAVNAQQQLDGATGAIATGATAAAASAANAGGSATKRRGKRG
ncbi:hypothetical protein MPSEU_000849900 [Mayamaea pseudoterrestris]|nr:hypothetical protein MPSEU_000849900 [Mayamaea pseudoterrestris]